EQRVFGFGVQRGGGLVEDEDERLLPHEAARQRQLLPLPEAHLHAARPRRAKLCFQSRREFHHHIVGPGASDRRDNGRLVVQPRHAPAPGGPPPPNPKEKKTGKGPRGAPPPLAGRFSADPPPVDENPPGGRFVHLAQHLPQRPLPPPVPPDDRDNDARRQ